MVRYASAYAEQGWPVFPLAAVILDAAGNRCACWDPAKCLSPGKHPATRGGLYDATTDIPTIEGWGARFRDFNIGVRTGVAFDALDIDGDEGRQSLDDVLAGREFTGLIQETGRGLHFLVKPTGYTNRAHVRPGIDFRGVGGYIVVAPSVHINGTRYRWRPDGKVDDPPEWMSRLLAPDPNRCRHVMPSGRECGRSEPHGHRGGVVYPSEGMGLI